MAAVLERASQQLVTKRVLRVDTQAEQVDHILAYQQHGYQHKGTFEQGDQWIMHFIKSETVMDSTEGDKVPL